MALRSALDVAGQPIGRRLDMIVCEGHERA